MSEAEMSGDTELNLRQNCGEAIPQEETPLNLARRDAPLTQPLATARGSLYRR